MVNKLTEEQKVISENEFCKIIEYEVPQYKPGAGWYKKTVRQTLHYEPLSIGSQCKEKSLDELLGMGAYE